MDINEFRHRRAKRGFGARRAELLKLLWQQNNDITHYIIRFAASGIGSVDRVRVETERAVTVRELLEITLKTKNDYI